MPLLAAYCEAHRQYMEIHRILSRDGLVKTYPSGYQVPHPMLKHEFRLFSELRRLSNCLGLNPLSRARLRPAAAKRKGKGR